MTGQPARRGLTSAALALVAAVALTLVGGCASPRRDECRKLSAIINATTDRVDKAQASPLDPSGLKSLAEALEKTATEAEALKLTVPELNKQATDYGALMREVAKTARDMAAGGEAGDITRAEAANQEMVKAIAKEPPLIAEVNKLCPSN